MGIEDPGRVYRAYPFQLSGGMNQRAMIAMSLAADPRLLLVDEPTRGLDDRSRAQVIDCLGSVASRHLLVVTHDLWVARALATHVGVMRHGRLLEDGACDDVLGRPRDPYTCALVSAGLTQPWSRDAGGSGP